MDPDKVKAAIDAIENKDGDAAVAILKALLTDAASDGKSEEASVEDTTAEEALAEGVDEEPVELTEHPEDEDEEERKELKALSANLIRLTGTGSTAEAMEHVKSLGDRQAAFDQEQQALDTRVRKELITELVKLGVETPATAWAGDTKDRKPVKRLSIEPLKELRSRVKTMRVACSSVREEDPAESGSSGRVTALSENDQVRHARLAKDNPKAAESFLELRLSRLTTQVGS